MSPSANSSHADSRRGRNSRSRLSSSIDSACSPSASRAASFASSGPSARATAAGRGLGSLNHNQGGIYMGGWLKDGVNSGGKGVGLGLEDGAAAAFDFV